jgi:hypothetical protein
MEHQALRLRLAELSSRLTVLRFSVWTAAQGMAAGACGAREAAALKVTAARFAEEAMSECMHLFGGPGYLEDETPLARMWRDARLARLGGGSDEMMWELVASGMSGDAEAYERAVAVDTPTAAAPRTQLPDPAGEPDAPPVRRTQAAALPPLTGGRPTGSRPTGGRTTFPAAPPGDTA